MDVAQPGLGIGRDISKGEQVENELTAMIERRHNERVKTEGERAEMEAWRVTELREEARKREENRLAWCDYFERIAGSLRARAAEYDHRAQTLIQATNGRKSA